MTKLIYATKANLGGLCTRTNVRIRAYKVVTSKWTPPTFPEKRPELRYFVGSVVKEHHYSKSNASCASGLNVATLPWCMRQRKAHGMYRPSKDRFRLIVVEFLPAAIVATPRGWMGPKGKFRVKALKVIKQVTWKWAKQKVAR